MPKKADDDHKDRRENQNQWIAMMPDAVLRDCEDSGPVFCKLRHPKTDEGAMYLFPSDNKTLYEVLNFDEPCRSWFIEETVQEDGRLIMTTPVDPVFLALPYLIKAHKGGKFMQLDLIFEDSDYPETHRLSSCEGLQHLSQVADCKGDEDLRVYRYSSEKALDWLSRKVERLSDCLQEKKVQTGLSGAHDVTFVPSAKTTTANKDDYIRFAHGMISDYLPLSLSRDLMDKMGIKEVVVHEKPAIDEPASKRSKTDIAPAEDYSKENGNHENENKKMTRMTLAQKKLDKVDKSGMKNISSFFSPKAAKK